LTQDEILKLLEKSEEFLSIKQIHEITGINRSTVGQAIGKMPGLEVQERYNQRNQPVMCFRLKNGRGEI
jgi:hypothetical protein